MIRNGHAGFGRRVSEKGHKAPRRGPTSADPTGDKARAVKARYQRACAAAAAPTRNRATARGTPTRIARRATRARSSAAGRLERVLDAISYGAPATDRLPSSYDWSRTPGRRRGGDALERLERTASPSASVVTRLFGTWAAACAAALRQEADSPSDKELIRSQRFLRFGSRRRSGSRPSGLRFGDRRRACVRGRRASPGKSKRGGGSVPRRPVARTRGLGKAGTSARSAIGSDAPMTRRAPQVAKTREAPDRRVSRRLPPMSTLHVRQRVVEGG